MTHNADVNAKDADGRSTLYILALENRLAMARFLLEHARADVESRDSEVSSLHAQSLTTQVSTGVEALIILSYIHREELLCM